MLTWLLEESVFEENIEDLKKEIISQGHEYISFDYMPFDGGFRESNKKIGDLGIYEKIKNKPVLFYGSINAAKYIKRQKINICPGVYYNIDNFNCRKYYAYYGKYLLNNNYIMMPLQEAIRQKDFIFSEFGKDIFIRPDSGNKEFTGCLVNKEEFNLGFFNFGTYFEDFSILSVISSPKNIDGEWRFIIGNGEVITGSQYRLNMEYSPESGYPEEAFEFASKIAKEEWQPDDLYAVDICKYVDNYYLLEINSFSCSGFYCLDFKKLVNKVTEIALKSYKEIYDIKDIYV